MNRVMFGFIGLSLFAMPAKAVFVIDNFSNALYRVGFANNLNPLSGFSAAVDANVSAANAGTRSITTQPGGRTTVGAGSFAFNAAGNGGTANMTYNLTNPFNLSNVGIHANPSLSLRLFGSIQKNFNISVALTNGNGTHTFSTVNVSSPTVLSFDGSAAPVAIAGSVSQISITMTQAVGGGFGQFSETTIASISANPEPASMALLGMSMVIGGLGVMRRNRPGIQQSSKLNPC